MDDCISRQTVLRCIKESRDGIDWGQSEDGDAFLHYSAALYRTVASEKCVPAADVAPVVHGRWKKKKDSDLFYCSECELPSMHKWPYCERCGAKMDGERKE